MGGAGALGMTHRPAITILPYEARWPEQFEVERQALCRLLAPLDVRIEHIGSTAVTGLSAKPIIDVMLGCAHMEEFTTCIPILERHAWEYVPEHEEEFPDRRFLAKPRSEPRQFHLHAVEMGTAFWQRHLSFRDYLRSHPDVASSYEQLKLALAARFGDDREAYTEAKTPFIVDVLRRAEEDARDLGGTRRSTPMRPRPRGILEARGRRVVRDRRGLVTEQRRSAPSSPRSGGTW